MVILQSVNNLSGNGVCDMRATKTWFFKTLAGGLTLLGLLLYISPPAAVPETEVANTGLIRLHVLANSDSRADQELKRKVRDEIIRVMAPEFLAAKDIDSARQIARNSLDRIELIAGSAIKAEGKDYPVTAELNTFPFPTKHYGAFILPAGDYEAVKVVIGSGAGTNWWCVLFPPLCFVDMTRAAIINTRTKELPPIPAKSGDIEEKQPACPTGEQTAGKVNSGPETSMVNKQKPEDKEIPATPDANPRAAGEEEDCRIIFSFKLIEWLKRL